MKNSPIKIIFILLIFFIFSFHSSNFKSWKYLPTNKTEETYIYVVSHGWHTGVVILKENLGDELKFLHEHFGISPYYEIGWGDKGFYEAEEITIKLTLQALFIPTPSVLHIVAVPSDPEKYFSGSEVIKIPISKEAHAILNQNIHKTFERDKAGDFIKTKRGLYGKSFFFVAKGSYYITNTCNTWTARILEEAGLPISSFLTLTARSVRSQARDAANSYRCCIENLEK
jgi:uncharacterized protein (TIGR02117 family)